MLKNEAPSYCSLVVLGQVERHKLIFARIKPVVKNVSTQKDAKEAGEYL